MATARLLRIAFRNITRQRRRTLLVLAAVGLGVTAVVGVRGFLNGLQSALVLGFAEGTVGAVQVHAKGFLQSLEVAPLTPNLDVSGDLLTRIEHVDGVVSATPRIAFPGMVSIGDDTTFAMIVAVDPVREIATCPRRKDFVGSGAWLPADGGASGGVKSLIGAELLRSLHAKEGARAAVLTSDVDGVMNAVDTAVGGSLIAPTQGEKKLMLLPLAAGQELLRIPGRATEIAVRVKDLSRVDEVAAALSDKLGPDYEVHTWKQVVPFAADIVETQDAALSVITIIFLIVIMMGLANAMLTSVLERVREIGTLMAVGARRRQNPRAVRVRGRRPRRPRRRRGQHRRQRHRRCVGRSRRGSHHAGGVAAAAPRPVHRAAFPRAHGAPRHRRRVPRGALARVAREPHEARRRARGRRLMLTLLRLAFRSLLRNRRRSAITIGAVALGVAIVVFASGFALGFVHMMLKGMLESRLGAVQVHHAGYLDATEASPLKLDIAQADDVMRKISAVPGVTAVAPRIRFGGLLSNGQTSSIVMGEAVDAERELSVCPMRRNDVDVAGGGAWLSAKTPHGGIVGRELAKALGAKAGGVLTLSAAGREGALNALDLDVAAVSRGETSILDSKRSVILALPAAQELLQMNGRVTEIAVRVDDLDRIPSVAKDIRAALGPELEVSTWDEVMPFLRDAVNRLRIILTGVSAVLFFIVVFGIVNTMLMNVYERTREIGTLLALGVKRRQVLAMFLTEAWVLGLVGGGAGALLGLVATAAFGARGVAIVPPGGAMEAIVYPEARLDIALAAIAIAMIGALLASAYPARKASLMNPVDALRTT